MNGIAKNNMTFPKKELLPYDTTILFLGISKRIKSRVSKKCLCTCIHVVALSTAVKMWKKSKCPLIVKWINKIWNAHTMDYYFKRKEILLYVTT